MSYFPKSPDSSINIDNLLIFAKKARDPLAHGWTLKPISALSLYSIERGSTTIIPYIFS